MNRSVIIIVVISTLLLLGFAVYISTTSKPPDNPTKYDDFARCLTEKGAVMYGSYSCSHCLNQKKEFASSFKFIKYVECTSQTEICLHENIESFPTWVFGNGTRLTGEQSFISLSQASSCPLPE